ncbi:hypothetical protein H0H87_005732 [Tephrocybe sp. NHM501043]|nr:hypothetical protein H0H87_005732 [Tephrocybe sp. NHM501043]
MSSQLIELLNSNPLTSLNAQSTQDQRPTNFDDDILGPDAYEEDNKYPTVPQESKKRKSVEEDEAYKKDLPKEERKAWKDKLAKATGDIFGRFWNSLPKTVQAYWEEVAQVQKEEHRRDHPEYKYQPSRSKRKNLKGGGSSKKALAKDESPRYSNGKEKADDSRGSWREELAVLLLDESLTDTQILDEIRKLDWLYDPNKAKQDSTPITEIPVFSIRPPSPTSTGSIPKRQRITAGKRRAARADDGRRRGQSHLEDVIEKSNFNLRPTHSPAPHVENSAIAGSTMGSSDIGLLSAYPQDMNTNRLATSSLCTFETLPWNIEQPLEPRPASYASSAYSAATSGPSTPHDANFPILNTPYEPQPRYLHSTQPTYMNASSIAGPSSHRQFPDCDDSWFAPKRYTAPYATSAYPGSPGPAPAGNEF